MAGSPRIVCYPSHGIPAKPPLPNCCAQSRDVEHPRRDGAIPFRYVTENRACQGVANPPASTPSVTPNDRPDRHDTVAGLLALQAEYATWYEALPDSLRDSATAEALQAIVDLDLDELTAIVPLRGYGRD